MNSITVNVTIKKTMRYKVVALFLKTALMLRMIKPQVAVKAVEKFLRSDWAVKWRLDDGKWQSPKLLRKEK